MRNSTSCILHTEMLLAYINPKESLSNPKNCWNITDHLFDDVRLCFDVPNRQKTALCGNFFAGGQRPISY